MKAYQFWGPELGLQLKDLPIPKPGRGDALIQVKAAGLCHSDTHVLHGGGAAWMCALPVVLGHEVAGVIIEVGESEDHTFRAGDRVAVACTGHPIEERNFQEAIGVGRDGGYAEYTVAPIKNLVHLPDSVSFADAAVATDSIATAYHAVVSEGRVGDSSTVAVLGLGGLGLNGVAIAALRGAKVYGVDINTSKFSQAKELGAIDCATSLEHFADKKFDVIIDFAGAQQTIAAAMSTVWPGGTIMVVGLAAETIQFTTTDLVTKNIALRGSTSASLEEFREVVSLLESGALKPQIKQIPFDDVANGLEMLGSGQVTGRLYVVPSNDVEV
ncbi:PKS-ER domain-containing protein [Fusarium sp. LHS14.1]|nr:PKS-ER domain-containing protein [Fusarium sp. LHS14.1]